MRNNRLSKAVGEVWRNLPSPIEVDLHDERAARRLITAILATLDIPLDEANAPVPKQSA